jgi:hypothetical protein
VETGTSLAAAQRRFEKKSTKLGHCRPLCVTKAIFLAEKTKKSFAQCRGERRCSTTQGVDSALFSA